MSPLQHSVMIQLRSRSGIWYVRVNTVLLTPLTGGELFKFTFTSPQLYMIARLTKKVTDRPDRRRHNGPWRCSSRVRIHFASGDIRSLRKQCEYTFPSNNSPTTAVAAQCIAISAKNRYKQYAFDDRHGHLFTLPR